MPEGDGLHVAAGSLNFNISKGFDYRGQPRQVFVKQGVVAADHGRCSDTGASHCQKKTAGQRMSLDTPAQGQAGMQQASVAAGSDG